MEENEKLLSAEITDNLSDLRVLMDALRDIRGRESEVEIKFGPVESTYQLLEKYEVTVAKDEFDKVSDMRFKWKKLRVMANERNAQIARLQGGFKRDLIAQVCAHDSAAIPRPMPLRSETRWKRRRAGNREEC